MFVRLLLFACCASVLSSGGAAQTFEDVARCRAIQDDARRLGCYDAIRLSPALPRSKFEPVPLAELTADPLSYRGRMVEVVGRIEPAGAYYALSPGAGDPDRLPVDTRALPRQHRDRLLNECQSGCQATIQGRVGPVNFVTGIVGENVLVH